MSILGRAVQYLRGDVAGSADVGSPALAIRKDTGADTAGADGDYGVLQMDANGNLRVNVAVGGGAPSGVRSFVAVTILSGAAVSGTIDPSASGLTLVGLFMPAAWTAAAIGFQVTPDGTAFPEAYNTSGVLVQIASPTAATYIPLDPADFIGFDKFRLHSVTAGSTTGVNQGADRAFTLVVKGV